jgi:hypothetical protein
MTEKNNDLHHQCKQAKLLSGEKKQLTRVTKKYDNHVNHVSQITQTG